MDCLLACIVFLAVLLAVDSARAEGRPSYTIYRAGTPITVDGRLDEPAWVAAPDVGAFVFPWYSEGKQEQTVAKMLWDDTHLYVAYICEDAHIWADHTERNSAVYDDDCVEVFAAPNPDLPHVYFNIEMNVLSIFLDRFNPKGAGEVVDTGGRATGLQVSTFIAGTLNNDEDTDSYWVLEAAIPFENFDGVAKHTPPLPGDVWHLNLNRLGGKTNVQFSQWTASRTDEPQFHAPDDFGRVTFSDVASPFWKR